MGRLRILSRNLVRSRALASSRLGREADLGGSNTRPETWLDEAEYSMSSSTFICCRPHHRVHRALTGWHTHLLAAWQVKSIHLQYHFNY